MKSKQITHKFKQAWTQFIIQSNLLLHPTIQQTPIIRSTLFSYQHKRIHNLIQLSNNLKTFTECKLDLKITSPNQTQKSVLPLQSQKPYRKNQPVSHKLSRTSYGEVLCRSNLMPLLVIKRMIWFLITLPKTFLEANGYSPSNIFPMVI